MEVWDIFFYYSGELNLIDIIKLKGTWLYAIWTAYLSWNSPKPYFHGRNTSVMFPKTPELFVNKLLWKNMLVKVNYFLKWKLNATSLKSYTRFSFSQKLTLPILVYIPKHGEIIYGHSVREANAFKCCILCNIQIRNFMFDD